MISVSELNTRYWIWLVLTLVACDQSTPIPEESVFLERSPNGRVSSGLAQIEIQDHGGVFNGRWHLNDESDSGSAGLWGLSSGGLWISSTTPVARASASGLFPQPISDLEFWNPSPDSAHYFLVDDKVLEQRYANWPTWLDAPSYEGGRLKRYGHSMVWATFRPKSDGLNESPLADIRIGVTAFVSNAAGIKDMIFLRYDISNTHLDNSKELLIGHYSDIDASGNIPPLDSCGLNHNDNHSAFDTDRGLAYVYRSPDPADGDLDARCYGIAVGIGFLDLSEDAVPRGIYSSRIVTRFGGQSYYPSFSEEHIHTAKEVVDALLGLDVDGQPMIDPTTNEPTRYAFTGDPISGSGWLDERNDPRQLLSKPPFVLDAGETKSILLVVMNGQGANSSEAISDLKAKYDLVNQMREIWDF